MPIAFVDLVPVATEKVSRIRSNIVWDRWKRTLRARSIRVNLNHGKEMQMLTPLVNLARGNTRISRTEFVYDERSRDCKCLLIFELPA